MSENQPTNPEPQVPSEQSSLPVPVSTTPAAEVPATTTPAPAPLSTPSARPLGITIISILAFIQGFLGICGTCVVLAGSGLLFFIPTGVTQVLGGFGCLLALILGLGPLLELIFAYGAWNLRSWAWLLGIIATGLAVAGVVISILGSGGATVLTALTNGLLSIIIFVYLLLPGTRKAFNM
jgi:hypothetical protein